MLLRAHSSWPMRITAVAVTFLLFYVAIMSDVQRAMRMNKHSSDPWNVVGNRYDPLLRSDPNNVVGNRYDSLR